MGPLSKKETIADTFQDDMISSEKRQDEDPDIGALIEGVATDNSKMFKTTDIRVLPLNNPGVVVPFGREHKMFGPNFWYGKFLGGIKADGRRLHGHHQFPGHTQRYHDHGHGHNLRFSGGGGVRQRSNGWGRQTGVKHGFSGAQVGHIGHGGAHAQEYPGLGGVQQEYLGLSRNQGASPKLQGDQEQMNHFGLNKAEQDDFEKENQQWVGLGNQEDHGLNEVQGVYLGLGKGNGASPNFQVDQGQISYFGHKDDSGNQQWVRLGDQGRSDLEENSLPQIGVNFLQPGKNYQQHLLDFQQNALNYQQKVLFDQQFGLNYPHSESDLANNRHYPRLPLIPPVPQGNLQQYESHGNQYGSQYQARGGHAMGSRGGYHKPLWHYGPTQFNQGSFGPGQPHKVESKLNTESQ